MEEKKIYMPIPSHDVFYGIRVTKKTKVKYENESVKQKIENLTLYTEQSAEDETFKFHSKTELKLQEGDLLLLEEDGRGYFKPVDVKYGTFEESMKEMEFIKQEIDKCEV